MVLSMPAPFKHPKTAVYWLRQRVPAAVGAIAKGKPASVTVAGTVRTVKIGADIKVSLGTKDPREAKERAKEAQAGFDLIWSSFATAPVRLSHRQTVALSGEVYRWFEALSRDDPEAFAGWAALRRRETAAVVAYDANPYKSLMISPSRPVRNLVRLAVDHYLSLHHTNADAESRGRLLVETDRAFGESAELAERRATGDYSPDTAAKRFPAIEAPTPTVRPSATADGNALPLMELLEHKRATQSLKASTVTKYRGKLNRFIAFTSIDDAMLVTKDHVREWRDSLVANGLSKKSVNDMYLAALKAVLSHGVKEFNLRTNVADKLRDKRDAPAPSGSKGYSREQATSILSATFKGTAKGIATPYQRAIFWVPWICAYTGLRVTEVTQFQGRNLGEENGIPFMLIDPKDGSTKSGKAWTVGIHKHLIDLGLLDMFRTIGDGPAFYRPYSPGTDLTTLKRHRAKDSADRVATWITEQLGAAAPGGRPSHAWRHTFTTLTRTVQMDTEARNYMMGSRSTTDAREGYGDWPPAVIDAEVNRVPRFHVPETAWRPSLEHVGPTAIRTAQRQVSRSRSTKGPHRAGK